MPVSEWGGALEMYEKFPSTPLFIHFKGWGIHPGRFSVINNPSLIELAWAVWRNIAKLIRGGPTLILKHPD